MRWCGPAWFRLGFRSGYVADVLHNRAVLADPGHARDARLHHATEWRLARRHADGRWTNQCAYNRYFEHQGQPSTWVTLQACRFLRQALA